jgi:hypothetical protein
MFFQLSLPSTPTTAETAGDTLLQDLGTTGTLTVQSQERPARDQIARLLAFRPRDARNALRCQVGASLDAPLTFTANCAPAHPEGADLQ